ncbi:MAG: hypothetical protein IT456_15060 [Planctomycetes bacterium]|jgi:hypothetical protein|nr:hypothetical protein [Planctomycetota bacterium]
MQALSKLSVILLMSATAVAQTLVVPPAAAAGDPSWTQNIWREVQTRNQAVYDTSTFTSQGVFSPVQINSIEYRIGATFVEGNGVYPNVQVSVGYAATDYAAIDVTFANNRSASFPTTPNFVGPVTVGTSTGGTPINDYLINIPLQTPFLFDPSLGQDLLVELYIDTVPSPAPAALHIVSANSIATHKCSSVRVLFAAATTATTGAVSAFCPAVRFGYSIPPGVAKHDPYGTGCYTIASSWYEAFPGAYPLSTNDLSGNTVQVFSNGSGGHTAVTVPGATIVAPTTTGLALGDDVVSAAITLPFTFDYPGGSTSTIYVDSNGSIALGGAAAPGSINTPTAAALLNATHARICASLQDLLPDGATNIANVYAEVDPSNPSVFLITWLGVPCFQTTPSVPQLTSTFQIALIDGGGADAFELRYQTLVNDSDSSGGGALTGFSKGGGAFDGGNYDLTASVVQTATELGPLTLSTSARPIMGNPVTYTVSNIRSPGVTLMQASFGQDLAGTPLTSYGLPAPGCSGYLPFPGSMTSFGPLVFSSPTGGFSFTWPVGYAGVQVFVQAFELETSNPENPAGVITSNGLQVLLGTL